MSDRNKSFRGHCNIDVSLDLETNSVLVELSYKPEILQQPLCRTMYKYHYKDVVEELRGKDFQWTELQWVLIRG